MKTKRRPHGRRRPSRSTTPYFRDIITANAYGAMHDESYSLIHRCVEETLKDPDLRDKIEYHAREIIKAIAAKL